MAHTRSIIIGIDFGTTYSKVVFAESDNPDELLEVSDWPANQANTSQASTQVPTVARYLDNGKFEWGGLVPEQSSDAHRLFKLALEPALFQKAADTIGDVPIPGNVDKVITDYLTGLWDYVVKYVCERFDCDKLENVQVILTVPAIWSDLSKQRTVQAFQRIRNLDKSITITLLSEPEAAAISALQDVDRNSLKHQDTFVVLDAGGGTVDLITYTITSLFPVLEVQEATAGTGDFCGSSLVNLRFDEFMTARLQHEPKWSAKVSKDAHDRFENEVKRGFSLASVAANETHNIPVGGLARNPDVGIMRNGVFALKSAEIHMFFERYILRTIQLAREQIRRCEKPVRSILLVGGFGASRYLRERLELAIKDDPSIRTPVEILQPPHAWLAAARGAVKKGLAQVRPENYNIPMVISRQARKHYGIELGVPYNSVSHASLASKQYWNGLMGEWYVPAMVWFIRKGNNVSEDIPFLKSYSSQWPVGGTRPERTFPMNIYADETSQTAPIGRSSSVKLLCRLSADLSSIPDHQFGTRLGVDGRMYYYLEFDIEAVYHSASTQYTLIYQEKRYDTVSAEYV
ncbi:hypothetical protein F5Y03DRAFT_402728 [Xylaria venustula]|nr:hypothetical protein F5Y03DRAFT_402728 [Xylaria venustula]